MAYNSNTGGAGGATTFLALTDSPSSFSGEGSNVVSVNVGETALEFTTPSAGATTFLALTDTPSSFTAGRLLMVNAAGTALEEKGIEETAVPAAFNPTSNGSHTLGTATRRWGYLYCTQINSTAFTVTNGVVNIDTSGEWFVLEQDNQEILKINCLEDYIGTDARTVHFRTLPTNTDPSGGGIFHTINCNNASYNIAGRYGHVTSLQFLDATVPAAGIHIHEWGFAIDTQGTHWVGRGVFHKVAAVMGDAYNAGTGTAEASVGFSIENPTAAAAGAQQHSGSLRWRGNGWKTDATAASQYVDFFIQTQPIQGAAAPTGDMMFSAEINETGHTNLWSINSAGFTQHEVAHSEASPPAGASAGAIAYFSDGDSGSPTMAWYNGSNWIIFGSVNAGSVISGIG